jgi:hypothetical protein
MNIFKLKLKTIRGSLAVVLLKELLQELKVTQGDSLLAAETGRSSSASRRRAGRGRCGSYWI